MKIVFEHVTYRYTPDVEPALKDLTVEFDTRSILGICGMAGSGKSTFIQHINGLLKPTMGRVLIDEQDIHASPDILKQVRQRTGMTFQFPERQLFGRTVWEELTYTLKYHHLEPQEIEQRIATATDLLEFNLPYYRDRSPFALSRGEQRRLGIAVMLSLQPDLLILDEPTAGMDRRNSLHLLELLKRLHRHKHLQLILVSHHLELLLRYADYLIILANGKSIFAGIPMEVDTAFRQLEEAGMTLPRINRMGRLLQIHKKDVKSE